MTPFEMLNDTELIAVLQRRGYVVRHGSELRGLLWNRTEPIPNGIDFEVEALGQIRNQLTPSHLTFSRREGALADPLFNPTIRSAVLRIF